MQCYDDVPAAVRVVWSTVGPVPNVGDGPICVLHISNPVDLIAHAGSAKLSGSNVHIAKGLAVKKNGVSLVSSITELTERIKTHRTFCLSNLNAEVSQISLS